MAASRWISAALVAVAVAMSIAAWLRHEEAVTLRAEVGLLREDKKELARQRAENRRLKAAQLPAAELAALQADHDAVVRLRAEIEALKARTAAEERAEKNASAMIPASAWKNAGRASSEALIETLFWAAANGDVDTIKNALIFDNPAHAAALAAFNQLPEAARAGFGSSEKMIARLMAQEGATFQAMRFAGTAEPGQRLTTERVWLESANQNGPSLAQFPVMYSAGQWALVVRADAVTRYTRSLAATAP